MKNRFIYFLLLALVTSGAVSGAYLSYKKAALEKDNTSIELVMDLGDITKISLRDGVSADDVLKSFKYAGLTSISVTESTLEKLQTDGKIAWLTGYETAILDKLNDPQKDKKTDPDKKIRPKPFKKLNPALRSLIRSENPAPGNSLVISRDSEDLAFAERGLSLMLGKGRALKVAPDTLIVLDDEEDLLTLGIGLEEKELSGLIKRGFYVIPRFRNNFRLDEARLSEKLGRLSSAVPFTKLIFDGEEVGGFRDNIAGTAAALKQHGIDYGYIEMAGQKGDSALISLMGADTVRVHSISEDEMQKRMTMREAADRLERAFYERGIRVLFIRPFYLPEKGSTLTKTNAAYISEIRQRITKNGFIPGEARSFSPLSSKRAAIILIALGLGGALVLTLRYFLGLHAWQELLLFAVSVAVFSASRELSAFAAAATFPVLAVCAAFNLKDSRRYPPTIAKAMTMVLTAFFISMLGGLYVTGALADTAFMTGARQFAGVKIAFIAPLLAAGLYWALNEKKRMSDILARPVTFGLMAGLAVAAGAAAVYILRSGNFGIGVPDIERTARSLLENMMLVRPRTKEFLIGYPALFLGAVYYLRGKKDLLWAFLVVGSVGPVSTINTFCHAHSPFLISVLRSFYGALLGLLVGLICYVAAIVISRAAGRT